MGEQRQRTLLSQEHCELNSEILETWRDGVLQKIEW